VYAAVGIFLGDRYDQSEVAANEHVLRAVDLDHPATNPRRPARPVVGPQCRVCEPVDGVGVELQASQITRGDHAKFRAVARRAPVSVTAGLETSQPGLEFPDLGQARPDTLDRQAHLARTALRQSVIAIEVVLGQERPLADLVVQLSKLFLDDLTLGQRSDDAALTALHLAGENDLRSSCQERDRAHLLEINPQVVACAFRLKWTDIRSIVGHPVSRACALVGAVTQGTVEKATLQSSLEPCQPSSGPFQAAFRRVASERLRPHVAERAEHRQRYEDQARNARSRATLSRRRGFARPASTRSRIRRAALTIPAASIPASASCSEREPW